MRSDAPRRHSVAERLFQEGFAFDFFQAVRLLERLGGPRRVPVGRRGPPAAEVVRFRAHQSLHFPASAIYSVEPPTAAQAMPVLVATFMGLTGPSGVLPRHYTELLLRLARDSKGAEKGALAAWFDLFNHRLISLFYRAWEKYHFTIAHERGEHFAREPDAFTQTLFSLVGLGLSPLRRRLHVVIPDSALQPGQERVLARIDDLTLLHYSGFFAHRPRCASSLQALLQDYFGLPVEVRQFQGQWLLLDEANRTRLGAAEGNSVLALSAVAGDRVWDVQGKFRIRLGPLRLRQFDEFLPQRSPVAARKSLFVLSHLVRLYVGAELDFEVQLVLAAADVPPCQLSATAATGPYLGWNTWVCSQPLPHDADDAVLAGEELVELDVRGS
jgi:type VI secretion system protein ImpH